MGRKLLRPATEREVSRLWPAVRSAHLFDSAEEFERARAVSPWRVQISENGDAAIVRRWREHLPILAISALWCSHVRLSRALADLTALARDQEFDMLLSPLVGEDARSGYRQAGMTERERIVTLRGGATDVDMTPRHAPSGVRLRSALPDDVPAILDVDAACFDEFWRYGPAELAEYYARDRTVVAECSGEVIGYTLCTVENGAGTLGRLAVHPSHRREGVGATLVHDALGYMFRNGAGIVSLCTQEANAASRAVYARVGLRELPDRLHLYVKDVGEQGASRI